MGEIIGWGPDTHVAMTWPTHCIYTTRNGINVMVPPTDDIFYDPAQIFFASYHPGGCHFLFCDGSVHFLLEDIDSQVLRSLTTRAGVSNNPDPAHRKDVPIPPDYGN